MENGILTRKLSKALIISGTLNIILLASLFYLFFKEMPPQPYYELKPASIYEQTAPLAIKHSNLEILQFFKTLTFEQLVNRLYHSQLVEDGYSQRDLSLAILVSLHHFDIFRSLNNSSELQSRKIPFGKNKQGDQIFITIYSALSDEQFKKIISFAQTERWPLTSKGLYLLLRKQKNYNSSLADAFYMTMEFRAVENMFQRSGLAIGKADLLSVICQGQWSMLASFTEQQRTKQDLSTARRQRFLLDYINNKSVAAAQLLLKTDGDFVLSKLDDRQIIKILELLKGHSFEAEKLARSLLVSPRNDAVRNLAAVRLYEFAGEKIPSKNTYQAAISRFITPASKPVAISTKEVIKIKDEKKRKYVVKEGDSLWKIAKKFKIDIAKLKNENHLKNDTLRVGSELIIP